MSAEGIRVGLIVAGIILAVSLLLPVGVLASDPDMAGWEADSPYNQLFSLSSSDVVRGTVLRTFAIAPMPGMARGLGLFLKTSGDKTVVVHLGPAGTLDYLDRLLAPGDRAMVRGAWARQGSDMIFMASRLRINETFEIKLRRSVDGRPCWTLDRAARNREPFEN